MTKKEKQHEAAGVDAEIQNLFSPEEGELEKEPEFLLPEKRKSAPLPIEIENKDVTEEEKLSRDAEYARNNIYELTETGMAAVQDLSHLAREQMHPRVFEILSKLLKDVTDNNIALLELANKKKSAKGSGQKPPEQVNNIDKAIFVGTTSDLLKHMATKAKE